MNASVKIGWRRTLRRNVFLTIVAFMVVGPFYRQVLGGDFPLFRQWRMFRAVGLGVVDATFFQRLPDGREVPIDRFRVLGHPSRQAAPPELRRLVGRHRTWEVARELCDALGPGADVRVVSREAFPDGWRAGYDGGENLCSAPPPPDSVTAAPRRRRWRREAR